MQTQDINIPAIHMRLRIRVSIHKYFYVCCILKFHLKWKETRHQRVTEASLHRAIQSFHI